MLKIIEEKKIVFSNRRSSMEKDSIQILIIIIINDFEASLKPSHFLPRVSLFLVIVQFADKWFTCCQMGSKRVARYLWEKFSAGHCQVLDLTSINGIIFFRRGWKYLSNFEQLAFCLETSARKWLRYTFSYRNKLKLKFFLLPFLLFVMCSCVLDEYFYYFIAINN